MKWLVILLSLLLSGPALADGISGQGAGDEGLTGMIGTGAGIVPPLNNLPSPAIMLDFVNNVGTVFGSSGTAASFVTVTRTTTNGSATNLMPTSASGVSYTTYGNNVPRFTSAGLLVEQARNNYFPNSNAPVTAATNTLPVGPIIMWVNGSGSAAATAGTGTGCSGTATQGTPATWTMSVGGTCTITVTGSLNAVQVENPTSGQTPGIPTSFIVTTTSIGQRALDSVATTGTLLGTIGTSYTIAARAVPNGATTYNTQQTIVSPDDTTVNNRTVLFRTPTTNVAALTNTGTNGVTALNPTGATAVPQSTPTSIAAANTINSQMLVQGGLYVGSNTAAYTPPGPALARILIGTQAGASASPLLGSIAWVKMWPQTALTQSQLLAITQ